MVESLVNYLKFKIKKLKTIFTQLVDSFLCRTKTSWNIFNELYKEWSLFALIDFMSEIEQSTLNSSLIVVKALFDFLHYCLLLYIMNFYDIMWIIWCLLVVVVVFPIIVLSCLNKPDSHVLQAYEFSFKSSFIFHWEQLTKTFSLFSRINSSLLLPFWFTVNEKLL